jgi:hypothetical protein
MPESCAALPATDNSCLQNDFLDASDDSVFEHDFDPVRMLSGFSEDSLNDALCELSAALILLFNHADLHSRLDLRSGSAVHGVIMVRDRVSAVGKFAPDCS